MQANKTAEVGRCLKEWREAKGVSQYVLSERSGIHRTQIVKIEKERASPRLSTVFRFCEALGISVVELLGGPPA